LKIKVEIIGAQNAVREFELKQGSSVRDVLRQLGIPPDGCVYFIRDEPVPVDEELRDGDVLTVLSAASGG
jgi:sulfur carrier protein ThiS